MALLRRPAVRMFLIGAVASVIGVVLALVIDWFPPQASTQAKEIDRLYDVLLIVSVPIFVLVMTVAIYSVVRFRARPGDKRDGEPIHGNTRLEVIWVAIPFILVSGLAGYAWVTLNAIEAPKPNTMQVTVEAQQFAWAFQYPGAGGKRMTSNELVLPVDRPVQFNIRTMDVIHSFWVPAFRMKQDAVPGITTRTFVTPDRVGRYDVVCSELCGAGHSTMRQSARVVSGQQFAAWLDHQPAAGGTRAQAGTSGPKGIAATAGGG